jgi:hypothetical protein
MRLIRTFILLLFCIVSQAHAEVKTISDAALSLEKALRGNNSAACYHYSTQASHPYIKRILSYKLQSLIPKHVTYDTPGHDGNFMTLHATSLQHGQETFVVLVFSREQNQWKFDFPETMRVGLGNDWEQQLADIEQLYVLSQSQSGNGQKALMDMLKQ